jgi:hypothetical protein
MEKVYDNQIPVSKNSSHRNSYRDPEVLATDEDAELKRAILQLIFVDDLATLRNILQLSSFNAIGLQTNEQYEFDLTKENSRRAI